MKSPAVSHRSRISGVEPARPGWFFLLLLLTGLLIRAALLPLPGTIDVLTFKIWAYNAATLGPAQVYGSGGSPLEWRTLTYDDHTARVDYPPLALDELALVGVAYRALFPEFPDGRGLTIAVKLPAMAAGAALMLLLLVAAGRRGALAYWLNPAVVLHGAALGYIGELFALPAVGALVAATSGVAWLAGALVAAACLTKPQGLFIVPAVALALLQRKEGGWRALATATLAAAFVIAACVWPLVMAGAFFNMCAAVGRLVTDDTLSANGANVWWIVTYAAQVAHDLGRGAWVPALTRPVEIVSIRSFLAAAGADSSLLGIALLAGAAWAAVVVAVGWALRQARRRSDLAMLAALGAFTVHAYTVLSVQVHENHVFLALPLLAIAAAARPRYRRVLLTLTAIAALNLNLFYGFGDGLAIPRGVTWIDASVLLALVNGVALAWHASVLRLESRMDAA